MNAICLVIDRLHVGYLGCYGSAWVGTPAVDRLAARSFVFDQVVIDSPSLDRLYRSYWRGVHAAAPEALTEPAPVLPDVLTTAGISTTLITDEKTVAAHPLARRFAESVQLSSGEVVEPCAEVHETQLAGFFTQLVDWLQTAREPFFLWAHSRGMGGPWDAPLALRNQYLEDDDPPASTSSEVPQRELEANYDPDELRSLRCAYAGQVALMDRCLAALLEDFVGSGLAERTLLVLLSPRGFPLGEHHRVGGQERLHAELVQVPWLWRFPNGMGAAARSQCLIQPSTLAPTLVDWWGLAEKWPSGACASVLPVTRDERAATVDRACVLHPNGQRAIRTPAWYLVLPSAAALERDRTRSSHLFAKPDDRWELNDVADRCSQVVEYLEAALVEFVAEHQTSLAPAFSPLAEMAIRPRR